LGFLYFSVKDTNLAKTHKKAIPKENTSSHGMASYVKKSSNYKLSSITACAAAKIRYFSMSYIILLNNIRLFNFFVSVYYD